MINLSVGSKVFVVGEYLALSGGPAVVALTNPRFELNVKLNGLDKEQVIGIHPQSPAGQFIQQKSEFFKKYRLEFHDPYSGTGGFGASTAQFALVAGFYEARNAIFNNAQPLLDYQKLLKSYQELAWNKIGLPPSGADLLAQFQGGLSIVNASLGRVEKLMWSFSQLTIGFVKTGHKVATHEHLQKLGAFDSSQLLRFVNEFIDAVRIQNEEKTIESFNAVGSELAHLGFQSEQTQRLVQNLKNNSLILGAKGCGALGADVVAVLFNKSDLDNIKSFLKTQGLFLQSTLADLGPGFQFRWSEDLTREKLQQEL